MRSIGDEVSLNVCPGHDLYAYHHDMANLVETKTIPQSQQAKLMPHNMLGIKQGIGLETNNVQKIVL